MKTIKVLATGLMLFLAAGVNVVSAQEINTNGSIYDLQASYSTDGKYMNLSFYSTYDMNEITGMFIHFYQGNPQDNWSPDYPNGRGGVLFSCNDGIFDSTQKEVFGEVSVEQIQGNIYKISNKIPLGQVVVLSSNETFKCRLYLEGTHNPALLGNPSLRLSSTWQSNILTFFFDPLNTALNEINKDNKDCTFKYYFLSGIESKTKPIGIPYIQATFKNGIFITSDKIMQARK